MGDRPLLRWNGSVAYREATSSAPCGGTFPSRGRLCGSSVVAASLPQLPQTAPASSRCLPLEGKVDFCVSTLQRGLYNPGKTKNNPEQSKAPLVFYRKQLYNQSIRRAAENRPLWRLRFHINI